MGLCNEKPTNTNIDSYKAFLSIDEYEKIPIVCIDEAVEPLVPLIPQIQDYVQLIKQKCVNPADELTSDQSASIMLHSIIWQPLDTCLYTTLNTLLQNFDRNTLQPWLLYLKLLFSALLHLPSNQLTVYLGSKSNPSKDYQVDDIIIWHDLPLCTISIENLRSTRYLEKTEIKTLFTIECSTIRNIDKHCYIPSDQFVVFLPGTKFKVVKCSNENDINSCFVMLQEIEPSYLLHSLNDVKSNLHEPISSNIFQRYCLSCTNSRNHLLTNNHTYHNSTLERRIIKYENSWTVDLDRQNLTDQDMETVVRYAINRKRCKRIRLRYNNFTSNGVSILSQALLNNKTLKLLDLRNNQLSDLSVEFLALAMINSNIETLNLESNNITANGGQHLAKIIRESQALTELYLSKNDLGDQGVKHLAIALSEDKTITQETLKNGISTGNCQSILQHLYLGQNHITDEGIKYLCDMLMTNRTLTWLWLTGNEISNPGVKLLSNVLANYNVTLEWLFLDSNQLITDLSVDDFIYMLERNNQLKTLYINNCNLSNTTKVKLVKITKLKPDFDLEV